jgi:cellulose synthase/poly-beta-1,6-N-acetylglucosamine synthase-like glycosyltransferase
VDKGVSLKLSIGICAYNEENNIGILLKNLSGQNFPRTFELNEIIVVSSGSTDRTNKIVNELAEKNSRIKLIKEKERTGKAQALNIFFENAKGNILIVISADTKPTRASLAKLVESIKPNVGGACAQTLPINENRNTLEFCYSFLWKIHNRVLCEESRNGTLSHLGGDMWAIRKGIADKIPKNVINDDAYLGIKLKQQGWKIIFVPNAEVYIRAPTTPIEYLQQRERIIIGHKQLQEVTGVTPTTIGALAFKKPTFSLKIFANEIKTYKIIDYPKILLSLFLEITAQTLARINFSNKNAYLKWKQIRGTKKSD